MDFESYDLNDNDIYFSGERSLAISSEQMYINLLDIPVIQLAGDLQPIKIDFSTMFYAKSNLANRSPIIVCSMENQGQNLMYQTYKPQIDKANSWNAFNYTFNIYIIPEKTAQLKLYIWNKDKAVFNMDDLNITISTIDPNH